MANKYATVEEYRKLPWRCFHCDEVFTTPGGAEDHFGNYPGSIPGCILKVQLGGERGMLMELRKAQAENAHLRQQMNEEYWNQTAFNAHLETLIGSYRPFRKSRTLQDVFFIYDSMEGRAIAAEERAERFKQALATCPCGSCEEGTVTQEPSGIGIGCTVCGGSGLHPIAHLALAGELPF